jgi:hypothetical protein
MRRAEGDFRLEGVVVKIVVCLFISGDVFANVDVFGRATADVDGVCRC